MTSPNTVSNLPFSVIIPTRGVRNSLQHVIDILLSCDPGPDEILVGFDDCELLPLRGDSRLNVFRIHPQQGPGGCRQWLLKQARNKWVASFDDDSWPETIDFFSRAAAILKNNSEIAVLSAASHEAEFKGARYQQISTYSGCGSIFSKAWMSRIVGFLPLRYAYGMEEVDVSLQLHEHGGLIVRDSQLRVIHDRSTSTSWDENIGAHALANNILFTWLRFPISCLGVGLLRTLSYIKWQTQYGSFSNIRRGLSFAWLKIISFRHARRPVKESTLLSWLWLGSHPIPLTEIPEQKDPS
ncbi:MAG: glycosyltransferase family A protein [Nitrospira sp.]